MSIIKSEFNKICRKAIEKHSKVVGQPVENVQLVIRVEDDEPVYELMIGFDQTTRQKKTFMEILDVKIDFMGKGVFVPPFLKKTLLGLSVSKEIPPADISAVTFIKGPEVLCWLYNGYKPVAKLTEDNVFDDTKIQME